MSVPNKTLRAFLFVLVLACSLVAAQAGGTERVVLIVIDGLRYSEGLGDPDFTHVPVMHALSEQGSIIEPFMNDGYTYTSRALPAIWCGAWTEVERFPDPSCGGAGNNYSVLPTVFEYYRKQLSRPEEDCVYVLGDVGSVWKASFDADYGPDYWPLYHSQGFSDLDVWHEARKMFAAYSPCFMMLYLADVDYYGHAGDWDDYLRSIEIADSIVGLVWNLIEMEPEYSGKTAMFVTNDHGRHDYDFTSHGDDCAGCRTIQLLAVGPEIKEGFVSRKPRTLRDITPTIGELLGFAPEHATGSPMYEILSRAGAPSGK